MSAGDYMGVINHEQVKKKKEKSRVDEGYDEKKKSVAEGNADANIRASAPHDEHHFEPRGDCSPRARCFRC